MEVEIKGLRLRLQYYGTWEGKKRPNFRSLAVFWLFDLRRFAHSALQEGVSGWVQKSKNYKWVET